MNISKKYREDESKRVTLAEIQPKSASSGSKNIQLADPFQDISQSLDVSKGNSDKLMAIKSLVIADIVITIVAFGTAFIDLVFV